MGLLQGLAVADGLGAGGVAGHVCRSVPVWKSHCRGSRSRHTPSTPDSPVDFHTGSTAASEETESTIDDEVAKLVDEAYSVCKETLAKNRPLLDATVDALLEKETIDGFELDALIEKYTGAPAPNPRPEAIAV